MPLLLVAILLAFLPTAASAATYHVRVTTDAVEVEARFVPGGDTIGMYFVESPALENGSADLVEDLRAETPDGGTIALEPLGLGDWKLRGADPAAELVLRYRLRLDHDQYPWGPGIDEVAYRTDDGLFFSGRALFLVPLDNPMADGVGVRFDLPDGWAVSHPWGEREGTIVASDADHLVFNCLFLGTHVEETVEVGDFTMVLAMGRDLAGERDLFVETMRPALAGARETFGGMPHGDRYLAVINRYPRSDGGAYLASYSLLIDGAVNAQSSVVWGHGVVHEVLHFWNGKALTPTDFHGEWFREGITDYLTVRLRAREGQDPRAVTWRKLENAARRQVLARMMMGVQESLAGAGEQKQRHRMLVYGGGLLAGLALDLQIREATGGERSLDDLLQELYREYALSRRPFTPDELRVAANRVAGTDLGPFFDRHVQGAEMIDLGALASRMGLQLTTMLDEFYLAEMPTATGEQRRLRQDVFGTGE